MMDKKIVILAGKGISTVILYNALKEVYEIDRVILEKKESMILFLKRRIKRLGIRTVVGQLAFQLLAVSLLKLGSKKRILEIVEQNKLNLDPIPIQQITEVDSVNSPEVIQLLKVLSPGLIIVNGTRIISKEVISAAGCKLMNMHAGITPRYRGVHGAYWAFANNDAVNSGVTVHFVDEGIDTGEVIDQKKVTPTEQDNFVTYPFLQLAAGIELLVRAIENYFGGDIKTKKGTQDSFLWYHPTIWFYLYKRVTRGVK
jgi:folate-dependent phosphoribosylglycinamide formyltransferase PurN